MDIAICDDCVEDIRKLEDLILKQVGGSEKVDFYNFSSGRELLESNRKYAVIFLDIEMEGEMDGTKTAERIRREDSDALIAFYTAYDYPASRIVNSRPFCYLVKNSSSKHLETSLEMILDEARKRGRPLVIPVTYDGGTCALCLSDILYISIYERGTAIYLTEKKAKELMKVKSGKERGRQDTIIVSREKLEAYYQRLKDYGFLYAKKSYIINIEHIKARLRDTVILSDDTELTVSRSRKKQFDEQIMAYWSQLRKGQQ